MDRGREVGKLSERAFAGSKHADARLFTFHLAVTLHPGSS
jgi:hypothetical protein